jgi:hypothetical protein
LNARAALVTRGLAEMTRLGLAGRGNPSSGSRPSLVLSRSVSYKSPTLDEKKTHNRATPSTPPLYRTVAEHLETWLELASAGQFDGQGDHPTPRAYVRQAFRKYLECGIVACGFARAGL